MECFVGIDLGSTTTKAVVMDDKGQVLGRGITNSRSNYDTAARVSKLEAFIDARLSLIRRELEKVPAVAGRVPVGPVDLEHRLSDRVLRGRRDRGHVHRVEQLQRPPGQILGTFDDPRPELPVGPLPLEGFIEPVPHSLNHTGDRLSHDRQASSHRQDCD